jgi:hypothetical protein
MPQDAIVYAHDFEGTYMRYLEIIDGDNIYITPADWMSKTEDEED